MKVQSPDRVQVDALLFEEDAAIPNNSQLPLLVYRRALQDIDDRTAGELQRLFESNRWIGTWQNGVFDYHHYHSNAHEVLGVCKGEARIHFGGRQGRVVAVHAGDVAILPAGTGHKCVESSNDFLVVGGYPAGRQDYDLIREEPDRKSQAKDRVAAVPLPPTDPLYGAAGILSRHWTER